MSVSKVDTSVKVDIACTTWYEFNGKLYGLN